MNGLDLKRALVTTKIEQKGGLVMVLNDFEHYDTIQD